jgi:Sulfotransferase domain
MTEQNSTDRNLDFIVIGTQKGGTTSLWQYLRHHPSIFMPRSKEAPFFCLEDASPPALAAYMRRRFRDAPADALLGKATPDYMMGRPGVHVDVVADRMSKALPDVRLIALLRDPIARAISGYTMAVRRGQEDRSIDTALTDLLDPDELATARTHPTPTNSYVILGEYGRILGVYGSLFPADRLLVTFSDDLARRPGVLLDEVLDFLGLPIGYRPEGLGVRYFRGGTRKRLEGEAEESLLAFLTKEILPYMEGDRQIHSSTFGLFYETWNVVPDDLPPQPSAEVGARLEEHFRVDAEELRKLGLSAPWVSGWGSGKSVRPRPRA